MRMPSTSADGSTSARVDAVSTWPLGSAYSISTSSARGSSDLGKPAKLTRAPPLASSIMLRVRTG